MRALCYAQTNIGSGRDNNEDNYYCNGTFKRAVSYTHLTLPTIA